MQGATGSWSDGHQMKKPIPPCMRCPLSCANSSAGPIRREKSHLACVGLGKLHAPPC
jgi:hypothetical protein